MRYRVTKSQLSRLVSEGFTSQNGTLFFDPKSDNKLNIDTVMGKSNFSPRISTINGVKVYSAYAKVKDKLSQDELRNILNTLKGKGPYDMDSNSYKNFIQRTAIFFIHLIKNENIDTVITVQSSAGISNDLKTAILSKLPYKPIVYDEAIKKNLNFAEYVVEKEKISPTIVAGLERAIEKAKVGGYFKIQKIPAQFRKFIKNWLSVDQNIREKIPGKNILLIDDFLTSGSTIFESINILKELGAANIIVITILK